MTKFAKARWVAEGDSLQLGMDFAKVDKKRRMVAGWATIDNVDTENDVVTAEASIDAFARSRGNLREMHKKDSAVGRIVSFKEDTFRVVENGKSKEYRGIFVKVYISEGAEDTWKKVLDGTLNGFSIGGNIVEFEEEFSKDRNTKIRKIVKYDLTELSLVDNPGNQYSDITNVFKIRKSADGSVTSLTGLVEEATMLNVFDCSEDEITKNSPSDSAECPVCEKSMTMIGFIEDGKDRDEKVSTLVAKARGGDTLSKSNTTDESVETGHEAGDPTEVPTPARTEEDEVNEVVEVPSVDEAAEEVDEVHDESEEIAKKIDSLKDDISEILSKNNEDTKQKIESLEKAVKDTRDFFEDKISELDHKFAELNTDLEATKSRQKSLEDSLEKINSGGAFRKSADVESAEPVQKPEPTWNGAFSVDNLLR